MTSTPPPPPSDETPDELEGFDAFVARRLHNALVETPPIDPHRRARHIAAAMSAFDEAAPRTAAGAEDTRKPPTSLTNEQTTGTVTQLPRRPRTNRSRWLAASAAALVLLIGVGTVAVANSGSDAGNNDVATAALDASQDDAAADTSIESAESAESMISASADPYRESGADAPAAPEASAQRSSAAPIDLGTFDSTDALADAVRSHLDRPDEASNDHANNDEAGFDGGAADADSPDATRSDSTCDTARFTESGELSIRFSAEVAGVPYLVAIEQSSGRAIGIDLRTCAETPL